MMNGWGFVGRGGYPQRFEEQYHCYSVAHADKPHLEVSYSPKCRSLCKPLRFFLFGERPCSNPLGSPFFFLLLLPAYE